MAYTGFPTPDLPISEMGFVCKPIFVPNIKGLWETLYGQIAELTHQSYWKQSGTMTPQQAAHLWKRALAMTDLDKFCTEPEPNDCIAYLPSAPFIDYAPSNPYYDTDIPSGYLLQPFTVFSEILPSWIPDFIEDWGVSQLGFTGYEDTDVLSLAWSFPILADWYSLLTQGLPRIVINVQGEGTVELHLLNVPLGGACLITVDVELNPLDIINGFFNEDIILIETNRDLTAVPPEIYPINIVEVPVSGIGNHRIYVTFLPALNDEVFLPVRFGGGLRSVVLCGVTPVGEVGLMDCVDVVNCIENLENDRLRVIRTGALGINANTSQRIAWDVPANDDNSWQYGQLERGSPSSAGRIDWLGEPSWFHVSATVHLTTASNSTHDLKLLKNGSVYAMARETVTSNSVLNLDTDVFLNTNDYLAIEIFSNLASTLNVSLFLPSVSVHNITRKGETGAQGIQGEAGVTGATGTVPPSIEYLLAEQIFINTDAWLGDLSNQYTDSPQDINSSIPAVQPTGTQENALCSAIMAWVSLYCEAKKIRIRGANFLNQVWDEFTDIIHDTYDTISNMIGWNPLEGLFSCVVDYQTALGSLNDGDARADVVCCLWGELKDIVLTENSLNGAISACVGSLGGNAHDIICMMQNDMSLEHTLNFYWLYGRALDGGLENIVCPCTEYSYLEYDFTVSSHGFTAVKGVWQSGLGWVGEEIDPDPDCVSRHRIDISKVFSGQLPKEVGAGYIISTHTDCGATTQNINFYKDGNHIQGMGLGTTSIVTNQKRTWSNSPSVTSGKVVDTAQILIDSSRCDCNDALVVVSKMRVWLDKTSQLTGTPSAIAPLGTIPNGSTDEMWWT